MYYKLISVKGTREFSGSKRQAIAAAEAMESELHPAFGVSVEDAEGNTIAEIPHDGTCYYVEVRREGQWHLVGQYASRKQAELIRDDYRSRGERARAGESE